jgi:hypothetical protein
LSAPANSQDSAMSDEFFPGSSFQLRRTMPNRAIVPTPPLMPSGGMSLEVGGITDAAHDRQPENGIATSRSLSSAENSMHVISSDHGVSCSQWKPHRQNHFAVLVRPSRIAIGRQRLSKVVSRLAVLISSLNVVACHRLGCITIDGNIFAAQPPCRAERFCACNNNDK